VQHGLQVHLLCHLQHSLHFRVILYIVKLQELVLTQHLQVLGLPQRCNHLVVLLSMDFVSQEHGVPRDGPKDSNVGG
jgi:hypothetical protein